MVNSLLNVLWAQYLKIHRAQIRHFMQYPFETQWQQLDSILQKSMETEWGKRYAFGEIKSASMWRERLPVQDYELIKQDIFRMMAGEKDVLWHGRCKYFAKSSGTTSDKSKFIPVTEENYEESHLKGAWRSVALMYENLEDPRVVEGKTMVIVGSSSKDLPGFEGSIVGDVSAVILQRTSLVAQQRLFPTMHVALMSDFEKKLEIMAHSSIDEDIRMIAGSPTWALVLLKKVLEITGKNNILEVWPQIQIFVHGAVYFEPYRAAFRELFPSPKFAYQETYNASEGYFAVQSDYAHQDMLLILDNSIFYEFIPMEEWDKEFPQTIGLESVKINQNYALVITTNSGLYRYKIGDTIQFTCLNPFRIKISGRTKQFINVFGEELMVADTDKAICKVCEKFNLKLVDYSVAPIFQQMNQKGAHEWLIEFEDCTVSKDLLERELDEVLKSINSDYEAKRTGDLAMQQLKINIASQGTFYRWLKSKNKLAAQTKIPRLANHRDYINEMLQYI